jgi:hypothetical protein
MSVNSLAFKTISQLSCPTFILPAVPYLLPNILFLIRGGEGGPNISLFTIQRFFLKLEPGFYNTKISAHFAGLILGPASGWPP